MGMKKKEINYQLLIRRICLIVLDIICIIAASILALLTRFEFDFSQIPKEFLKVIYKYGPFTIVITLIIFSLFRIYSSLWEYAGIEEVFSLIAACLVAAVAKIVIILFTWSVMPRSWYVLDTIYLMILIGATRVSYRLIRLRRQNRTFPWSKRKKVMIIGGGEAGRSLITEIQNSKYLDQKVVCIIDDDPYKIGRYINRDGDLTSSVRIASMSHFIAPGKRTITYVVFDKANQAGTLERTVQYEDYTPPKIHLTAPLRYSTTELSKANLTENMTAEDCLDGDLTSQIRTSLDDGMYNAAAGIYKVTVQVSNSAGDVCSVPLEVTVTESGDRQEQMKEYPVLSDYIAYTTVGHEIDPMSYVKGMEMNGATYTYADDGEALAGTREAISVKSEVDYSKAGVYPVEYFYTAEGAPTAVTKLFVVVQDQEGAQDGE